MVYPDLGSIEEWVLVGFADAALHSMPDKVGSVGGQVLILANKVTERACVLGWRSKQLQRVVHSSLGAEAFSLLELFGDLHYAKMIMKQMFGEEVDKLDCIAITDSRNLYQA